ncbi:MAG: hypothetical protein O2856_01120 [Planctomycetota bacterium]|nr:hypothetical protein [Planctomycetota bacterium]
MLKLLKALRQDEYGVILSAEIVVIGTVLVLGLLTGMVCLQKSINCELGDFAQAIDNIDQSYSFSGHRKAGNHNTSGFCCAFTAGSAFTNNECNILCKSDIIGCEGLYLQAGGCGQCGGQCGAGGVCGSCGQRGTAGFPCDNRPNCVSTGVRNMRVTEYPGTNNVPRTSNPGKSPIRFPELEVQPVDPACCPPLRADLEHWVPQQQLFPQDADSNQQVPERQIPLQLHPTYQHSPDAGHPQEQEFPAYPGADGSGGQLRPVPQTEPVPPIPIAEPQA